MTKYDEEVKDRTNQYQEEILKLHREKKDTIKYCKKIMKDSEIKAEQKSRDLIQTLKNDY